MMGYEFLSFFNVKKNVTMDYFHRNRIKHSKKVLYNDFYIVYVCPSTM